MEVVKALNVPPHRTWNMCMLAHVDHGKSALSDALVSANGIISARLAGRIRYMDSRQDEQRRGITMKSSAIALCHRRDANEPFNVINLVDSPGHCDFSGEVEAALRVCDGAVLVVDVVEGVCVQTVTVLRAALERGVRPVLVLNKIDRLFVELQLKPMEAYHHIQRVLEQVNVIMGVREVEDMIAQADLQDDDEQERSEWTLEKLDPATVDEENVSGYFSPELGNVAFASAIDGWAFRLSEFAALFSEKFGISRKVLMKTLWGNYFLQAKSKKIVRRPGNLKTSEPKPMFVQFVLTNLYSVYDAVHSTQNDMSLAVTRRDNIVSKLNLKVSSRDLKHKDPSIALRAIMSAWLPAAPALLDLIIEKLPNSGEAQKSKQRLSFLWPHGHRIKSDCLSTNAVHPQNEDSDSSLASFQSQFVSLQNADTSPHAPVLAYVTKMLDIAHSQSDAGYMNIRYPKSKSETSQEATEIGMRGSKNDDTETRTKPPSGLVAFARIFCGTITVGDTLHVYSPRYAVARDGSYDPSLAQTATVTGLYILMGRDIDPVSSASAGAVVGISGLGDVILKTATVSSLLPGKCLPLISPGRLGVANNAVVRVAVEPHLPGDMGRLQEGLRKLNQADPAVDTYVTSLGEHVITASGELHLERCLLDLRERFAKGLEIHVSPPIIAFRETILGGPSIVDAVKGAYSEDWKKLPNILLGDTETREAMSDGEGATQNETFSVLSNGNSSRKDRAEVVSHARPQDGAEQAHWVVRASRGTTFPDAKLQYVSTFLKRGGAIEIGNDYLRFQITAVPIPPKLATELDNLGAIVRDVTTFAGEVLLDSQIETFREKLENAVICDADDLKKPILRNAFIDFWSRDVLRRVWSSGPRRFGSNILVGPWPSSSLAVWMKALFTTSSPDDLCGKIDVSYDPASRASIDFEKAVTTGFQVATQAGPLCEEPLHGVAFLVESVMNTFATTGSGDKQEAFLPLSISGLVISSSKEAMRLAVTHANPRIMEAALRVQVSVTGDALGRTYTVLAKRRGRVLAEDMKDGVNIFGIDAILPLTESFGFADALRKQTSGYASAQMLFSHWETVEADPFWAPRTEEELEDLGLEDSTEWNNNLARKLINSVRRRKGLKLEEKLVENAEKQRTLSKKK